MSSIVTAETALLPTTNADGEPVVPMTDEQKYLFDLKGWLCLPSLIDEDQAAEIREHWYRLHRDPESVPIHERHLHGGPGQILLDHPVMVGILNELISYQNLASEETYGFRYDGTYLSIRSAGHDNFKPHGGGSLDAFAHNSHIYQQCPGKVFAGLVRVVWEMNEVGPDDGGTLLLSGSHKSAFPRPANTQERDCPLYETYTCPAGSALVFTEALCHSGTRWNNTDRDRVSAFTCFNTVGSKWHRSSPSPEVIAAMPPKRQSLFRGVWADTSPGTGNWAYDADNRAV